jgi:L-fucose isomerase-like protein
MANLSGLNNGQVHLSHCTVPFNLVDDYHFDTHYETGKGIAVCGTFVPGEYTILRLSSDFRYAFVAEGSLFRNDRKIQACRTQVILNLPHDRFIALKNNPLGNHHLLLRGNVEHLLRTALVHLNFTII